MTTNRTELMDLKDWQRDEWSKGNRIKASKIGRVIERLGYRFYQCHYK